MEIEGIEIPVVVDYGGVTAGLQEAGNQVKRFGETTKTSASTVVGSGSQMGETFKKVGTEATTSATAVKNSGDQMQGSFKSTALGMSQLMTSAFSLYQSVDNIEKKQYALEKAHLAAAKATESVDQAQKDYNEAVAKYGVDSVQAKDAMDKLTLAKDTAELADERVKLSQNNLNDSMMMAGLTVIPAVVSGIDGMVKTWKNLQGLNLGDHLAGIKDKLTALGDSKIGAIGSAVAGVAALGFAFGAFTSKAPEMKAAFSIMAGAMVAAASAQWILNIAAAYGLSLTVAGLALVGVAGITAAAVYALSSMYGAKAEAPPEVTPPSTPGATAPGGAALGATAKAAARTAAGIPVAEMPTVTPGAGMTPVEMQAAGMGEYIEEFGVFIPKEEELVHDDIAFKVSLGVNKGKYKWIRGGPEKGQYFTMEDLKRIQTGGGTNDFEKEIQPWFTWGFEERTDTLGNVWLQGKHFQKGGLVMGDVLGFVEKNEAVLPLEDTRAMDRIAEAIGGGGGTVITNYNTFNIDGSKDVDYICKEIAYRMRTAGGMPY